MYNDKILEDVAEELLIKHHVIYERNVTEFQKMEQ